MKLSLSGLDLQSLCKGKYENAVHDLCVGLKSQMELLDDLSSGSTEISFLKHIVMNILKLDGRYIQNCIKHCDINAILIDMINAGEIDVRGQLDGMQFDSSCHIFSKRGALKKSSDERRISFANTKFYDGNVLLTIGDLSEMSDTDYLFSMNGYHLPFYESTRQRSMYEAFFSSFIKRVSRPDVDGSDSFHAMQEFVCATYIITELCVDTLECIFEIIIVISTRIKAFHSLSQSNSPAGTPRSSLDDQDELVQYLLAVMNDYTKIFSLFKCRKLLSSIGNKNIDVDWLTKIDHYAEALDDANEIYLMNCATFGEMAKQIALSEDSNIKSIANDLTIYITAFSDFMKALKLPNGTYNNMLKTGREFIQQLDEMELKRNVKYGDITPRGVRSPRVELSKSGSGGLSSLWSSMSPRNYFKK